VQRVIWIYRGDVLGGDLGMDLSLPLLRNELEIGAFGVDDRDEGFGDINFEPVFLAWHGPRWDAAAGYSLYFPTGHYDKDAPGSVGKGFWTHMFTAGGTLYTDETRTWHASVLARYEVHSEKDDLNITPGDDFHFEWGVGRTVATLWDVGVAGYCHWQVSDDRGSDVIGDSHDHDRAFAVGPEISVALPKYRASIGLRHLREFGVRDRSRGHVTTLSITLAF